MTRHHFTLEHIARALQSYAGARLSSLYSQQRLSIVMVFDHNGEQTVLRISVDPTNGGILRATDHHRARKNTLDRFSDVVGEELAAVTKHPHDRIISFWFTTHQVHIEFFGGATANIVVVRDGVIVDALHDRSLVGKPFSVSPPPDVSPTSLPPSLSVEKVLARSALQLGPLLAREVCYRCAVDPSAPYSTLDETVQEQVWRQGEQLRDEALHASTYYVLTTEDDIVFSMVPLHGYTIDRSSNDLFDMLHHVVTKRFVRQRSNDLRKSLIGNVTGRLHRIERSIHGMSSDAATTDRASVYRDLGNALLSVPPSTSCEGGTVLVDHGDGVTTAITVDPKRTLMQNAQRYFDKARAAEEAAAVRAKRLPSAEREAERLRALLVTLQHAPLHELEAMSKTMENHAPSGDAAQRFRVFHLDAEYTLYVGKSAANNDELTMRFAKQNDCWLHARGVSGSHAVLRGPDTDRPPKKILEQAAAITAYYSNARNASYTPVVYTQRKYVRKPKGANVGAVTLEREQVVMVRPGLPAGTVE